MSDTTTLTVETRLANVLDSYGETRNEQLEHVLEIAERESANATAQTANGETEAIADVKARVNELHEKVDRLPTSIVSELR